MSAPWKGELSVCHDYEIHDASGHVLSIPSMRVVAKALVHRANAYPKLLAFIESLVVENDTDEWLEEDSWGYDYGDKPDEAYRGGRSDERNVVSQRARDLLAALASTREEG